MKRLSLAYHSHTTKAIEHKSRLMQHATIFLESKARAHIAYSHFIAPDDTTKTVILFVNGLMLPRSGWEPTIANIIERYRCEDKSCPTLLSYDRYGQGSSDPDPSDEGKPDGQTHDAADAARDMHDLLNQVSKQHLSGKMPPQDPIELILVCNSIGVPIARLFAQYYPGTVSGMIFLDSNMTNTDFVSIWPDPDASDFDESSLPEGVTPEELRKVRNIYRQIFHPSVPNKERLNRTTLSELLPRPDEPKLRGFGGEAPLITVVGHDWDVFAKENKVRLLLMYQW